MDTARKSWKDDSASESSIKSIKFTLKMPGSGLKEKEKLTCGKIFKLIGFYMIGITCFVPYNAILSGLDCFIQFQGDYSPEFVYTNLFFLSNFIVQMTIISVSPKYSYYNLIQISQILTIITLIINPLVLSYSQYSSVSFYISCCLVLLQGMTSAVLMTCLYSFVIYLDNVYITGVVTGHGLSGIIMNMTRLITFYFYGMIVIDDITEKDRETKLIRSFYIFYYIAAGFLLVNIFIWLKLKNHIDIRKALRKVHPSLIMFDDEVDVDERCLSLCSYKEEDAVSAVHKNESVSELQKIKEVLKIQKGINFMIMLNGFITFCLYPGILLKSNLFFDNNKNMSIISILIIYNIFDIFGREFPRCFYFKNYKYIYTLIVLRIYFIIIFVFITMGRISNQNLAFYNDYFVTFNIAGFAFTNGFIISNSFIIIKDDKLDDSLKSKSSPVLSSTLNLGIFLGTSFGYILNYVVSN